EILGAAFLCKALAMGLMGGRLPDAKREWLSRGAGWLLAFAVLWLAGSSLSLMGPYVSDFLVQHYHSSWAGGKWMTWFLPGGWVLTVLASLIAGKSSKTDGNTEGNSLAALVQIGPPLFLMGVVLLVSAGTHKAALSLKSAEYLPRYYESSSSKSAFSLIV